MKKDTKTLIFDVFWECVAQNIIAIGEEYKYIIEEYHEAILDYLYDAEDANQEIYDEDFSRAIALYNMEPGKYELMTQEKLCILYTIRCAIYDIASDLDMRKRSNNPVLPHTILSRELKPDDRFVDKVLDLWSTIVKEAHSSVSDYYKDLFENPERRNKAKKVLLQMMDIKHYIPPGAMMEVLFREITSRAPQCIPLLDVLQVCIEEENPKKLARMLRNICNKNYIE